MNNMKKLLDKITVENVKDQISNGLENTLNIAENIVGKNVWDPLPAWDRKKLAFYVHKAIYDNKLLENK